MENFVLSPIPVDDLIEKLAVRVAEIFRKDQKQEQPKEEEEFLTIEKTMEILHLAKPSIYGLTYRKKIPYIKKGKKLYFRKAELLEWLNQGRHQTKTEIETEALEDMRKRKI